MNDKNLKKIWLISIFVLLILFSMYLIYINKEDKNVNEISFSVKYEIVKNYNDFYTVNSCVYRYLTYLQSNPNALLKVLDDNYIKANNINENNIYNYLTKYEGNLSFSSKKMYEEKISSNIYKYYVYGYVEKDIMDSFPEKQEAYFIVKLDKKNNIFTIEPYDGKIF